MQKLQNVPRILIAAPQGRSGKTTITVGLVAALTARGVKVQPFKKGPDFIDPSWLTRVAGRTCRNLDAYLMDKEKIKASFATHSRGAHISIVEGAMGLFDGVDVEGSGSAAEIAKIIQAPVILVVNCTRMTRSVAAMVNGYKHFDPGINVAGVILNNVARSRHENMLRASIEKYCDLPVLGAMPKGKQYTIPDRHLGLVPAGEDQLLHQAVERVAEAAEKYLDLDKIMAVAAQAPALDVETTVPAALPAVKRPHEITGSSQRPLIGVLMDRSFTFYYPENLEALYGCGAELVAIDAINDASLPGVDALFIGGGFPEVMAGELEKNASLRSEIKRRIEQGLPVYAECGGLMYLGRTINWQDKVYQMVGALPFDVELTQKPQGHGYMEVEVHRENPFFPVGSKIKGHEFHHSKVINLDKSKVYFAYRVKRGWGIDGCRDGLVYKNVMASYNHLHALAVPGWAENLVQRAGEYKMKNAKCAL
ncbi:cobyrinic acid a,c-diamide synthase [Desulfohalotomaculum tongense]|uniref:cobyrinate a,c-diamide synthase n=1 Tax=Desulforadius tongensis TaxID=1216062 RepID=UPI00195758A5|nr:cobyrinate a,c-diamide synthase [Desulforadius tongensis]MBM7853777.1 cobyrinic acid a,c-diamide synthase [Desulforadius tongensis]